MSAGRRRLWLIIVVVATLMLALTLYRSMFYPPSAPMATLTSVEGDVRLVAPGQPGVSATPGARVPVGTIIQTYSDGRSVLSVGGDAKVALGAGTEIVLERLTGEDVRIVVQRGVLEADINPASGRRWEFGAAQTDAVAVTRDGRLSIAADGYGTMAVAARRGTVDVTSGDTSVTLVAGQHVVISGGKISEVMSIPKSILLKVSWPELPQGRTRDATITLRGETLPGTLLDINGKSVPVNADGTWSAKVPLQEGSNTLEVQARDVAGNAGKQQSPPIERDTRGPPLQAGQGVWK